MNEMISEEVSLAKQNKVDLTSFVKQGFDFMQLHEIRLGLEAKIDVSKYADQKYVFLQMREIRKGLEAKVDITQFNDVGYDWYQMREICKGLRQKLDVSSYADKSNSYMEMRELRKGLEIGISLLPYKKRGYDRTILRQIRKAQENKVNIERYVLANYKEQQLEQIWMGLKDDVDISCYTNSQLSGSQMKEIRLGLLANIDVSAYDDGTFNWMQMREIRLGMEHEVAVFWYKDAFFSARQMKEIRLGLEAKVEVVEYASYIWSATDMYHKRMAMQQKTLGDGTDSESHFISGMDIDSTMKEMMEIDISEDQMSVSIRIPSIVGKTDNLENTVYDFLKEHNIKQGFLEKEIKIVVNNHKFGEWVEVARGKDKQDGQDGSFTYFFRLELPTLPKIKSDDSIDYQNVDFFEKVTKGQKLAVYTPATSGVYGYNVFGKVVAPKRGKELPRLKCKNAIYDSEKLTYYSIMDGRIELQNDSELVVEPVFTYAGNVTYAVGNIKFNGDIHVTGYVGNGVTIEAKGDVLIDGNVEAANIKAGKNVLVRGGSCSADKGSIQAGGKIYGKYFEKIRLVAEEGIESNYLLNCDCLTMGKITVSGRKGAIVGGNSMAYLGIEAFAVGNSAEVKTYLSIGENEFYRMKMIEFDRKRAPVINEISIYKNEIMKYQTLRKNQDYKKLTAYQNIEMALFNKIKELETLDTERNELKTQKEKLPDGVTIKVYGHAYGGCLISIDDKVLKLDGTTPQVVFKKQGNKVAIFSKRIGLL